MKLFITGISGILGTVLSKVLQQRGHEVYGCDLTHSSDPRVVRADIADWRQLEFALDDFDPIGKENYDLLFHLAGEFGRLNGQAYPESLWRTNCVGTRQVIAQCVKRNIPLVFASSSEAYGLSELYNKKEPLREEMLDNHVPQFHNEYSLSKWAGERQIHTAVRNSGLKAIILRFFNVYGPPERYTPYRSVVCQFAWKLLNNQPLTINKEGKRSHLWIGDWAHTVGNIAQEGRLHSMLSLDKVWSGAGGTKGVPVFNIGGRDYESVEELYDRLRSIIPNSKSPIIFQERELANSATKQPNCVKAETYLDHFPVMPLQAGLEETVEFLKKQMRE